DLVPEIPQGLPSFGLPTGIDASTWLTLLLGGCVVALIGFSEGWGASKDIAKKTHDRLDTNQEFRAYGAGQIGAGILGGMAVAGSLSKTSAAEEAGAKSQMSNIMLAALVLLTLAFLSPAFQWLPEAALAAIVINAMSGSANPHALQVLWRIDRIDFALGFTTLLVVLAFDLLPAMITGIVLSIVYLVYRISFPARSVLGKDARSGDWVTRSWLYGRRTGEPHKDAVGVPGVIVYRFSSPLIFSNSEAFTNSGEQLLIAAAAKNELPHALVLDFEEVMAVDTTGSAAIISLFNYASRYDVELALVRVHSTIHELLELTGVIDEIGEQRIYDTIDDAVAGVEPPQTPSTRS
ncbi:MAG: hypothetical protein DRJ50_08595, partial [Actinobacteria bacterium]